MHHKNVKIGVTLQPIWWSKKPMVVICLNHTELFSGVLGQSVALDWTLPALDLNRFTVRLCNKEDSDNHDNKDMAIKILQLRIEGFAFDGFMHAAEYRPEYSQGYYEYASNHNLAVHPVIKSDYLGFNGVWSIEFSWPTFTWIHQTENLGWIHGKNL
jgi:hypothetical protein